MEIEKLQGEAIKQQAMDKIQPEYNYFTPQLMQEMLGNFLKWQFDIDENMKELIHALRGDIYDSDKGNWKLNEADDLRLANEKGIMRLTTLFRGHIGKLFMLGNFNQQNENQIMYDFVTALAEELFYYYDEYEIEPKHFEYIKTMFEAQAMACIRSGYEGFRVIQLVSSYKTSELIENNRQGEKKSWLGNIIPFVK